MSTAERLHYHPNDWPICVSTYCSSFIQNKELNPGKDQREYSLVKSYEISILYLFYSLALHCVFSIYYVTPVQTVINIALIEKD